MTQPDLEAQLAPLGLFVMGATEGHILIGAAPHMWPVFTASPEYSDGRKDPLDRWSKRVLNALATTRRWGTVFPSDGPPYAPFIAWATASGRFWPSPAGMLVHDAAGLMISIRGAFVTDKHHHHAPSDAASPCGACVNAPCATACPVDALSAERGYDVPACHAFLDTPEGRDCLDNGCKARRACPVSDRFGRASVQSAFHMKSFHPT